MGSNSFSLSSLRLLNLTKPEFICGPLSVWGKKTSIVQNYEIYWNIITLLLKLDNQKTGQNLDNIKHWQLWFTDNQN